MMALPSYMGLAGCGHIDEAFDCTQICTHYKDCFDSDYDSFACIDRCETTADDDPDFAFSADECQACIDDKACTESFACTAECYGIVP